MRVIFLGTGDIGVPTLEMLAEADDLDLIAVVCQPDRPAGRKRELKQPATKLAAMRYGVPVLQPEKIRSPEAVASIAALNPDLIMVMAYGQILPRPLLELPSMGCLNLHASLLPRHRGAAPIQAAIAEGDSESGITVIWMDEGLDTGDILLMRPLILAADETGESLHHKLALLARDATRETLDVLSRGEVPRVPQPAEGVTYAGRLTRDSARLDWSLPAHILERRVRAFDPWPIAWTEIHLPGHGVRAAKIRSAIADHTRNAQPGKVVLFPEDGLAIGTGDGLLHITKIIPEGRKEMPGSDFVRGNPGLANAVFQ